MLPPPLYNLYHQPALYNWLWKYLVTPFIVGIVFGIGNFGAYFVCHTKWVKKFEQNLLELIN
jgi:hypothetical protein